MVIIDLVNAFGAIPREFLWVDDCGVESAIVATSRIYHMHHVVALLIGNEGMN